MDQTSPETPASDAAAPSSASIAPVLSEEIAAELHQLSHDLSNSLEIVVQTSYLLSLAELKEPAAEWLRMLEGGVATALELNQRLRASIRDHSPK